MALGPQIPIATAVFFLLGLRVYGLGFRVVKLVRAAGPSHVLQTLLDLQYLD